MERGFKRGDTVGLRPEVREKTECPPGRHDNAEADIRDISRSDARGEVWLDQDLHGRQYWNQSDLVLIKAVEDKKPR